MHEPFVTWTAQPPDCHRGLDGQAKIELMCSIMTELGQANVSKHLQLLHAMGFVTRRRDGLFVHYSLADRRHEAKGRRRMGPRDITVHGECEPAVGLLRRKYGSTGRWRVAPFAHEVHWEREHSYQSNQEHNAGHRRLPRRNARMS